MQTKQVRKCVECSSPVRQRGKYLCYVCFEEALRDLLRESDPRETNRINKKS